MPRLDVALGLAQKRRLVLADMMTARQNTPLRLLQVLRGDPDDLASCVRRDMLEYFCNGHVDYRVRGIHVRLEVRWDWQAEQGDDTHHALYRGTHSRLAVRQGAVERFRPELYVLPDEDIS